LETRAAMRLAEKVGKIGNGRAIESAQRHWRRMVSDWRHGIRLDPDGLVEAIDRGQFEALRKRHLTRDPGNGWLKYLNLQKWMAVNLRRVRKLRLDQCVRKRILDLGCGAGYFLFISQCLGHDVIGLDLDECPFFADMILMLGLSRVIWRVRPFVRLPRFDHKFDLVTAFMICFNGHKSPNLWGKKEWKFFLDDLDQHLTPGGRVCLGFNREPDGQFFSEELKEFFESRGGEVHANEVLLPRPP
jgi:SAM-dependent methyltransferase